MNSNGRKSNAAINLTWIVTGFTAAIATIYVWLLPSFFHGYKTYSFFIARVFGSAIFADRVCIKARKNQINQEKARRLIPYLSALVSATLVAFLSLLIIANLRGVYIKGKQGERITPG